VVDADAVPALHDGQEGDEGGNHPAAADHQSHAHGRHLVLVHQRLAADSVVPAEERGTNQIPPRQMETWRTFQLVAEQDDVMGKLKDFKKEGNSQRSNTQITIILKY